MVLALYGITGLLLLQQRIALDGDRSFAAVAGIEHDCLRQPVEGQMQVMHVPCLVQDLDGIAVAQAAIRR